MSVPATHINVLTTPYLNTKGILLADLQAVCSCEVFVKRASIAVFDEDDRKIGEHAGEFVFRQLVDPLGESQGFERILDQKIQRHPSKKPGDKYVTRGANTTGFTPIGFDVSDILALSGDLIVCAGLADGYRIHQCTGLPVACGVGENNLYKIADQLATLAARARIIVAADNDNAGRRAALRSRRAWVVPQTQKDWSDVYQHEGPQALRKQLANIDAPLSEEALEKALKALAGPRRNSSSGAADNTLTLSPCNDSPLGVKATVILTDKRQIQGYDQLKRFAQLQWIIPTQQGRADVWELSGITGMGLLMAMLNAGLRALFPAMHEDLASLEATLIESIEKGVFDHVDVVAGSPALITLDDEAREGTRHLALSSGYDPEIVKLCSDAGGEWSKADKIWRFQVPDRAKLENTLRQLCSSTLMRLVFILPDPSPTQPAYRVGYPGLEATLAPFYVDSLHLGANNEAASCA